MEQLKQQKLKLQPAKGPKQQKVGGAGGQPKAKAVAAAGAGAAVRKRPALKDRGPAKRRRRQLPAEPAEGEVPMVKEEPDEPARPLGHPAFQRPSEGLQVLVAAVLKDCCFQPFSWNIMENRFPLSEWRAADR